MPQSVTDLLAIDIALLLPPDAATRVDLLNASLYARERGPQRGSRAGVPVEGFRFDATHLPHITLAQLFIRRGPLSALYKAVGAVLRETEQLRLRTRGLGRGRTAVFIRLAPGSRLIQLHERLMEAVIAFEAREARLDAFYIEGEPARPEDVQWVSQFRTASRYGRFDPHITLGVGELAAEPTPFTFVGSRVAVCHLGRYCTCRAILREWQLEPRSARKDRTTKGTKKVLTTKDTNNTKDQTSKGRKIESQRTRRTRS